MREILFKAKRIDDGRWVEGYLFETQENSYIAYNEQFDDDLFLSPQNIFIPIDKTTICQYTGLTDKNGNKIWENDVVLLVDEFGTVEWHAGDSQFTINHEFVIEHFGNIWTMDCEVYGNIFDNPEILEEQ